MNTVFKFYYQAWIVLSIAGGYGAYIWWRYHPTLTARASDVISRLPVTGLLGSVSVVLVAVTLTRARRGADDGAHYVLLLGSLALYLLFAAELFFVHDLFCWSVFCRQLLSIDTEHGELAAFDYSDTKRIEHIHVDVAVG